MDQHDNNQQPYGNDQQPYANDQFYANNQQPYGNPPPNGYTQPPGYPPPYPPPYPPVPQKKPNTAMAGVALACGILASTLPVPVIDIIFGIVGVILAAVAMRSGVKGLAIAGLVVSIIGTFIAIGYTVDELGLLTDDFMALVVSRF